MTPNAPPAFRSRQQVLEDLGKALHFSPEILETNRKGRLSGEQIKRLALRCLTPALMTAILVFGPFSLWCAVTSAGEHVSFLSAGPMVLKDLLQLGQSVESHGRIGALLRLVSMLVFLGMAAFAASRFPFALYFDLLDGKVAVNEGRVIARDEQLLRPNGRDPIEKYYFDMKCDRFQVNLAAYRAIEDGSIYVVYVLPRSQTLVSLEPKAA